MNFNEKSTQDRRKALADDNLYRRGTIKTIHRVIFLLVILFVFYILAGFTLGFIQALYHRSPDIDVTSINSGGKSSTIYDDRGKKVVSLDSEYYRQIPVSIDEIPEELQNAVISSMDPNFFDHYGVTVYSIINTTINSIVKQNLYSNENLITERLIADSNPKFQKNSNWIGRLENHLQMYFEAISLERNSSKEEILEAFLNNSSFGNGITGVEAASQFYYGKHVSNLNLSECVMLATIMTNPYEYDPYEYQEDATVMYLSTLAIMLDKAFITESAWEEGSKTDPFANLVSYSDASMLSAFNQATVNYLAKEFYEDYHVSATKFHNMMAYGNYNIYTTQDTKLTKKIQQIVDSPYNYTYSAQNAEVSLTLMEQKTGEVKVVIGGKNEKTANVNRATQMTRQPGTIFQVLATYVPGIDMGTLTLASVYEDAAYHYLDNHREVSSIDNVYDGLTTIREALNQPMNLVAARAQSDVTSQKSLDYLINLGFGHIVESTVDRNGNMITDVAQSICNGVLINGVTNLEVTSAVSALGNQGKQSECIFYTSMTDQNGLEILSHKKHDKRVIKNATAFLVSDALKDNGSGLVKNVDIAEIQGNTDEKTDFWCTGYSSDITATLWLGFADNRSFDASDSAKYIWEKIMKEAIPEGESSHFSRPADVTVTDICQESGRLAVPGICDHDPRGNRIFTEYFAKQTIPTTTCNTHVEVTICPSSGKLINNDCPKENYLTRIYLVLPKGGEDTLDQLYALPKKYKNGKRCDLHKRQW
ncbi:MAG: penicillin-binding protein [Lachnospiraceae bacterium]|nr:penicillin-binding protein [Lachnospiraceae bacterium]